jgi:hypothetical protein
LTERGHRATPGGSLVLFFVALAACASVRPPLGRDAGSIEIANRTAAEVEVAVDGRAEAVVGPGERVLIAPVHPGPRRLGFKRAGGGLSERAIEVPPGGYAREVVLPGMLGDVDEVLLPEPPAFGQVEVENALAVVVAVTFDGVERGRVMPGERRRFSAVPSGAVFALARDDAGSRLEGRLEVPAGGVAVWRVAPEGRPVRVTNATAEAVEVRVDGAVVGRVERGGAATFLVTPALHALEARCEPSRRRFEHAVDLREAVEAAWRIEGGTAAVVVENALGAPVEVRRDGASVAAIAAGQKARLEGLAAGAVRLVATEAAAGGGRPTVREVVLQLEAGDEARWRIEPTAPGLRVENRAEVPVELYATVTAPARGGTVRLGSPLAAGATTHLHDLAERLGQRPGPGVEVTVEAWTGRGSRLATHVMKLSAGGESSQDTSGQVWQVRAPTGSLVVVNASGEAVSLQIDGAEAGEVADKSSLAVGALAARAHVVEARGRLTGARVKRVVEVLADEAGERPTRVTFGATRVEVRVKNGTGEAVVAPSGQVAQGATTAVMMSPGVHVLRFVGVTSRAPHVARVEVPADATAPVEVELSATRASLAVRNELAEAVAVSVGGDVLGSVDAGARVVFDGLRPGAVRVEAVGVTTGRFRSLEPTLPASGVREVRFARRPATLIIENRSEEALEVSLEDARGGVVGPRRGVVLARRSKGFSGFDAGVVEALLRHGHSGVTQRQRVTLEEGERRLLVVEAPLGVVRLDNLSGAPVAVRRGESLLARLEAGARAVDLSLPAGTHDLELVWETAGESSGVSATRSVEVAVRGGVVSPLQIRPHVARLAVANRAGAALEVLVGDRSLGVVEAGGSKVFEGLPVGELKLSAREASADGLACERRAKGCRVTQTATLRVDGGQTASWVLVAP